MRYLAQGGLLLALIGGVAFAALEQPGNGAAVAPSVAWSPSELRPIFADDLLGDESTGSIDRFAIPQRLSLSDEQRGLVFLAVMNLPDIPEVEIEPRDLTVPLPEGVELQDLPPMVTRKVPPLDDYKFVKLGDRIIVVNPTSRAVVSQIPRYRVVLQ
jgi:Protein of unknown function (DUF1236)